MSYNKEEYYQSHVSAWKKFIKGGLIITIGIVVLLILMAIFLV